MLTEKKIKKLEKDLEDVQGRARVRTLSVDDVIGWITEVEKVVKAFPPEFRGMAEASYLPWTVANSYGYAAKGTGVSVTFTTRGDVKAIHVFREHVNQNPFNRVSLSEKKLGAWIENELGIEAPARSWDPGHEHFYAARRLVYRAVGANVSTGYINI